MSPQPSTPPKQDAPKESKDTRFKRVAGKRTADALASLSRLGGTANKSNYEYSDEQVAKITDALDKAVADVKQRFAQGGDKPASFDL